MDNFDRSRGFLSFFLFLIIFGCLVCQSDRDRNAANESKITLLCKNNERIAFSSTSSIQHLVLLPLTVQDEADQPYPRLLERWEHSDDYTHWTFFLKKDIKWQDGKPVTAQDVKFTLELITNPEIAYENRLFDEITVIDDFTCQLKSSKPFYALIYSWFGICPYHLLGELDPAEFHSWEFWTRPVGNGPYRYVRHLPDMMVELEVNPDYYGKEPEIKRIVLKFGGNPVNELLSGNVDAAKDLRPFEILQIAKNPGYNLYHEFDVSNIFSLLWNHRNPLFRAVSVRRALTLAINRRELAQVLNLPEDIPIFDASIVKSQFFRGEVPDPIPYDPELSRRLLDRAGWVEKTTGGIREKNGQKFRFSVLLSAEDMPAAVYIQDQFRRVGIGMETVTMDIAAILGRAREGKYEAILSNAPAFSYGWDYGGYDNPEFELLNKSAFTATSVEELEDIARNLWPIFQSDIPWTFLYPKVTTNAVSKRIKGLKSPHRSDPTRFMEYLWIGEE